MVDRDAAPYSWASRRGHPSTATHGACLVLSTFPEEVLQRVMQFLDGPTLRQVERVSRSWRHAASADFLWQQACEPWSWLVRSAPQDGTWRQVYDRLADANSGSFVLVGGAYHQKGRSFHLSSQEWRDVPATASERNSAALVRDRDGGLYVLGGRSDRALATVEHLPPAETRRDRRCERAWRPIAPLTTERCCLAAVQADDGRLVTSGGGESMYRHAKVYSDVECYDPRRPYLGWQPLPSLKTSRCAHSMALSLDSKIYTVGGYGGGLSYLDSIECLDLASPERGWYTVASLSYGHAGGVGCFGQDHCLYVVGGGDNGTSNTPTAIKWDPRSGKWTSLAPMAYPRHYFAGAFSPDGHLYVAGGFEWTGHLASAECYDPRADRWRRLPDFGAYMEFCAGTFIW